MLALIIAMKIVTTNLAILYLSFACFESEAVLNGRHLAKISRDVFKREESDHLRFNCSSSTLETLGKTLTLACVEFLTTQDFNTNSFQSSAYGLCETCGKPLFLLARDCVGETRLAESLDILCATNAMGNKCYDTFDETFQEDGRDMFSDCDSSPCSTACKRDLETSNEQHGCCVYSSVALLRDEKSAEQIWSRCDVRPPGLCTGGLSSSPVSPRRSKGDSDFAPDFVNVIFPIIFTAIALL